MGLFSNIFDTLYEFYMSLGLRWFIYIIAYILNVVSYYQNPTLFTDERKCMFGIPCRWFNFIAGMGAMTLCIFGLIVLWYDAPFSKTLPDFWYVPVALITYAIIAQITISVKPVIDNGNFNPPPEGLWPIKDRSWLYIVILILDVIFFHQMYLDGGTQLIENPRVIDDLILGRFGGWNKDKYNFMLEWFGTIQILLDILAIYHIAGFKACDYALPNSWNY
jgi:hypothetical protein